MNKVYTLTLVVCSSIFSFNAYGQKSEVDSVVYFSVSQIDSLLQSGPPEKLSRLLGRSKDNEAYLVVNRTKPGDVEIHEQFDDVAIIRSGHGILRTGDKVKGQKESGSPGAREWIGGIIEDGHERKLSPGDFLVIPAMLAHQYIPNTGETITYWTIKVRRTKTTGH
jgi:mannose-6-phosphate isomerase-like protein (cupin superfamily)